MNADLRPMPAWHLVPAESVIERVTRLQNGTIVNVGQKYRKGLCVREVGRNLRQRSDTRIADNGVVVVERKVVVTRVGIERKSDS